MLKDIHVDPVEDVGIAIVHEPNAEGELVYNVYLVNQKEEDVEGVLVSSKGYGEIKNEMRQTSVLRHFLDVVPQKSTKLIEPIIEDVFSLTNEYWVSFFLHKKLQDKKFLFVPGSIDEKNFIEIPILNKRGVFIV